MKNKTRKTREEKWIEEKEEFIKHLRKMEVIFEKRRIRLPLCVICKNKVPCMEFTKCHHVPLCETCNKDNFNCPCCNVKSLLKEMVKPIEA